MMQSISDFIREGFRIEAGMVVFATREQWDLAKADLSKDAVRVSTAITTGGLKFLDADVIQKRLVRDDLKLDSASLSQVLSELHAELRLRFERVSFHESLVMSLVALGREKAARDVEKVYDEFLRKHPSTTLSRGSAAPGRGAPAMDLETAVKELALARESLLRITRQAKAGRIGAALAHEINNPLAIVVGVSTQLRGALGTASKSEIEHKLEKVEGAATRISRLVGNLLRVSREEFGQNEFACVQEAVREAATRCQSHFGAKVSKLNLSFPPGDFFCRADEASLTQVFLTVLTQVLESSSSAGDLTRDLHLSVRALADPWIEVMISRGQSETEDQAIVAEKVGEAAMKKLSGSCETVQALGGQISSASVDGSGDRYRVLLPRMNFQLLAN
jgi:C4-dicarboxylate-specific signal transduction histidine kinase